MKELQRNEGAEGKQPVHKQISAQKWITFSLMLTLPVALAGCSSSTDDCVDNNNDGYCDESSGGSGGAHYYGGTSSSSKSSSSSSYKSSSSSSSKGFGSGGLFGGSGG